MKVPGWLPIQSPVKTFGTLSILLLSAWKSLAGYPYKALWRLLGHSSNWFCLHESPWLPTHTKPSEDVWNTNHTAAVCMKVPGWLPIQSPVKALGTLIKLVLSAWKSLAGYPYKALWRLWRHSSYCCCLHESRWLATHTKPCEGFGDTHQIASVCMKVPGCLPIQSPLKTFRTVQSRIF